MEKNELIYEFDYLGLNNEIEDGFEITVDGRIPFQHLDLELARKSLLDNLKKIENKKEDDVCIVYFSTMQGSEMYEVLRYFNGKWKPIDDIEFLNKNAFELLHESGEYDKETKETVNLWDEIVTNFRSFKKIDKKEPSQVLRKIRSFFHWYYLPEEELFAPSKFLGYKDATVEDYDSSGHGGETQKVLQKYFKKLDKESEEFKRLYRELSQIHINNFGKDLNTKVLNGTGGIYIPKN